MLCRFSIMSCGRDCGKERAVVAGLKDQDKTPAKRGFSAARSAGLEPATFSVRSQTRSRTRGDREGHGETKPCFYRESGSLKGHGGTRGDIRLRSDCGQNVCPTINTHSGDRDGIALTKPPRNRTPRSLEGPGAVEASGSSPCRGIVQGHVCSAVELSNPILVHDPPHELQWPKTAGREAATSP